ncbi:MAG: MYG1 family protein [Minisyncoccia bacterium]
MGENKVKIVTHNANFHADDIFAVATLSLVLENEEKEFSITRSRDMDVIEKGDYVVDVGGIHDPNTNRFDHHQEGGAGKRDNTVPYASFGLVWKKFGEKLCGSSEISQKIDQILIQWIDATDNGVQVVETKIPGIYPYDIGLFFNAFTPDWKEGKDNIDSVFMETVSIAKVVLGREILKRKNLFEASSIVEEIYKNSVDKRLVIFDRYYPSTEFLAKFPEPLFTVFPRDDGTWAIKVIRNDDHSFVSRKNLPESWAGKVGVELEKATEVPGSVFCHSGRFMVVAKTKEAILKLAEIALNS